MSKHKSKNNEILLSTVVLNWNREDLLRITLESYSKTVSVPYELYVLDNASTDGSRKIIENFCKDNPRHHAIFLSDNLGGEALNIGLEKCHGKFLHISENDLEYLPGWDKEALSKFLAFPDLGQLSLFSPFHEVERGEVWTDRPAIRQQVGGAVIYRALANVTTSCVYLREVWDQGVRWKSHGTTKYWSPDDGAFSTAVKKLGFQVAWNDRYLVINWGHNALEMARRLDYYRDNADGKTYLGFDKLVAALVDHGYRVDQDESLKYQVQQVVDPSKSSAAKRTALWRTWLSWLEVAVAELSTILPEGAKYLLIDEGLFGPELIPQCTGLSVYESNGTWDGAPSDSTDALSRIAMFTSGVISHLVFMWPSFWWLDNYPEFSSHLRSVSKCILENEHVIVFEIKQRSRIEKHLRSIT